MKLIFSFLLLLLSFSAGASKLLTIQELATIEQDVDVMIHNLEFGGPEDYISQMPPEFIEGFGGPESLMESAKERMAGLKEANATVVSYGLGEPFSRYEVKNRTIVIIPFDLKMSTDTQMLISKSYLIAVKYQEANRWYYLDGAGYKNMKYMIQAFLPYLPDNMEVPEVDLKIVDKNQ
ncbi:hypothetical protein [Kangiella sediminilitoris]|uniref:DUF302 domain-containing protein n=1 Tax=Kangiella sediminilitoris TaxID=1144748 RepID=A0A1B3B9Q7_9GAMM|nr:hypothetical protein [Kangiella sediminilitoris]AOE49498.1 hypothetical protein KS2013_774 [Kangiella sediminilitoris]